MDQLLEKLQRGKEKESVQSMRLDVPVVNAAPEQGLTTAQVRERMEGGWANLPVESAGKTTKQIILSNVFTYFNMLFFLLALCVIEGIIRVLGGVHYPGDVVCGMAAGILWGIFLFVL